MLPTLGLFKSLPCPLFPNCNRDPCVFSHERTRIDRPLQTIKRPKPETSSSSVTDTTATVKKQKVATPSSLVSARPASSSSKEIPSPAASIVNKTKPVISKPTTASASTTTQIPKKPTQTTTGTGPPMILPNIRSKIPLNARQAIANRLFQEFKRIYTPILSQQPSIATEHAARQEENILNTAANLAGYKQLAMTILGRLKKRPACTGVEDTGIDGEWKDLAAKEKEMDDFLNNIDKCVASVEQLKELGYPLPDLFNAVPEQTFAITTVGDIATCDRCKKEYTVKNVLTKEDMETCTYHPLRMATVQRNGEKRRVYRCCGDAIDSNGCTRGPHVYKEESLTVLHQKMPFVTAPARDISGSKIRHKLVALDCEMGYTTAGMELIRLTVVDEQKNKLLDELVLPSNMIIDLNTRFSGVKTLEGAKYDLDGIRKKLFEYVDQDTIIVGHGLENDMCALRLVHTKVVDTVILYPHRAGLPFRNSLRGLASSVTKKFIQDSSDGHDSLEDASICIDLLKQYIIRKKQ
ncbi:hypothetical protein RMCBS344292_18727 [Rhizopus microsporus]|nr:hypothetical protein RMCBS344292_18727 [Rhizopus microsporus]